MIDASSAILLVKAGFLELCVRMYSVKMTRSVFNEVTAAGRAGAERLRAFAGRRPGIAILGDPVASPGGPEAADLHKLDRGERDSLQHVINGVARFVIIDDGPGVRVCRRLSIPHVNALLCPRLLLFSGRITPQCADLFFRRIAGGGRYSGDVRRWAANCRPSDLAFFLDGNLEGEKRE